MGVSERIYIAISEEVKLYNGGKIRGYENKSISGGTSRKIDIVVRSLVGDPVNFVTCIIEISQYSLKFK